jgi:hypothetical protein
MAKDKTKPTTSTKLHQLVHVPFDVGSPTISEQIIHRLHVKNTNHKKLGRHTSKDLVCREAKRLLDASSEWQNPYPSLRSLAHKLSRWLANEHPTEPQMKIKIVERHIRGLWQQHQKARAEATDDATVVIRFAAHRARDVPLFVAALPIFSRSYYAARRFDETTLEVPLGSGPYKVGGFEPGRHIEYERVKEWRGADLPVARGQNNFDIVRYEYYRDREVAFEGFTAKSYLFREEFTSRTWATRYDFPAIREGQLYRANWGLASRSPASPAATRAPRTATRQRRREG